jgi:hypothetical protein
MASSTGVPASSQSCVEVTLVVLVGDWPIDAVPIAEVYLENRSSIVS